MRKKDSFFKRRWAGSLLPFLPSLIGVVATSVEQMYSEGERDQNVLRRGEGSDGGRQKLNEGWAFIKILILMLNQEEKNYFLLKIFLILMFLIGI